MLMIPLRLGESCEVTHRGATLHVKRLPEHGAGLIVWGSPAFDVLESGRRRPLGMESLPATPTARRTLTVAHDGEVLQVGGGYRKHSAGATFQGPLSFVVRRSRGTLRRRAS